MANEKPKACEELEELVRTKFVEAFDKKHFFWSHKLGRWLSEEEFLYGTGETEPLGLLIVKKDGEVE